MNEHQKLPRIWYLLYGVFEKFQAKNPYPALHFIGVAPVFCGRHGAQPGLKFRQKV